MDGKPGLSWLAWVIHHSPFTDWVWCQCVRDGKPMVEWRGRSTGVLGTRPIHHSPFTGQSAPSCRRPRSHCSASRLVWSAGVRRPPVRKRQGRCVNFRATVHTLRTESAARERVVQRRGVSPSQCPLSECANQETLSCKPAVGWCGRMCAEHKRRGHSASESRTRRAQTYRFRPRGRH